jgi:hypothetical protein
MDAHGMSDVTPEELAERLSALTGFEFSPTEMLSTAHVLLSLPDDDPRRERLYLALARAQEAEDDGNPVAFIRHALEFMAGLLRLTQ